MTDSATLIAPLFDDVFITEAAVPSLVDEQLFPEELRYLEKAVPKRRAEFGTARVCARRALARMGIAPCELVPAKDRSPRWPSGIIGSITHTHGYCGVVLARSTQARSLGLDAERDKPLDRGLIEMICTESEREWLGARADQDAVVYFGAKEAFYKCQYALTQQFLSFQDVELDVDFARGEFRARVIKTLADKPDWLDALPGRFVRERGLVLCGVTLAV